MASVMNRAARAEDNSVQGLSETVSRLEYENKILRDLLSQTLASDHGSVQHSDS